MHFELSFQFPLIHFEKCFHDSLWNDHECHLMNLQSMNKTIYTNIYCNKHIYSF